MNNGRGIVLLKKFNWKTRNQNQKLNIHFSIYFYFNCLDRRQYVTVIWINKLPTRCRVVKKYSHVILLYAPLAEWHFLASRRETWIGVLKVNFCDVHRGSLRGDLAREKTRVMRGPSGNRYKINRVTPRRKRMGFINVFFSRKPPVTRTTGMRALAR